MSGDTDNMLINLAQFGLSEDEGRVYISLLTKSKTALLLSRELKLARTKVYRLIEKLTEKGLIKEEVLEYGTKFNAESPNILLHVMNAKERELSLLKMTTPTLINQLTSLQPLISEDSKIMHYRGAEGLKQVTWNSTKVEGFFRIYEFGESMNSFLDQSFSEKVRKEYVKNSKTQFRQITNLKKIPPFTQVEDHLKNWEVRHIPKSELDIKMEVIIYNNVYCTYHYADNDVFIVEIYNEKLAEMQKQIFDLVWKNAKKMKIIDRKTGEASL